jgi:hypothetical protein
MPATRRSILDTGFFLCNSSRLKGDIFTWLVTQKISLFIRNDNLGYKMFKCKIPDTGHVFMKRLFPVSRGQNTVSAHFLKPLFLLTLIAHILSISLNAHTLEYNIEGQFSGWAIESDIKDHWEYGTGIRYIPDIDISRELDNNAAIDSEISLNMYSSTGSGPYIDKTDIDLYRADIRYTTTRTETRIGLQKINFGPAVILRTLKWFDQVNPTDPLQLTDGIYALRFRYVAPDNSNLWIWFLYGNDGPRGYDIFSSVSDDIEAGGRIQSPLLYGDMGFTFHTRTVDSSGFNIPDFRENRYSLDGRWDIVIGLWFESLLQEQKTDYIPFKWTKRITLGADYTFDIGSGIYLLTEHMVTSLSEKMMKWQENYNVSAFQMSYTLGLMDSLSAIGYFSWEQNKFSQYISWTRTYDNFILNVSLFNYPESSLNIQGLSQSMITEGRGIQIMVIYNH